MSGTLAPYIKPQFLDDNGDPLSGYQLFTYVAGTSTKQDTYSDVALTTPNANPIILDAAGRPGAIYLSPTSYKFVLAPDDDTDPPTSPYWTQDNVSAVPSSNVDVDVAGTAGESLTAPELCYLSEGDGGRTAGRWYKADSDLAYGSKTAKAIGFCNADAATGESTTFRIQGRVTGLSALSAGTVYYASATAGEITSTYAGLAYRRKIGIADSTTSLIVSMWLPDSSATLQAFTTATGNVGSGEDILATYTVPASTLFANQDAIWCVFGGTVANNANAKTVRLRAIEGGNNNLLVEFAAVVSEDGKWELGALIMRNAATTFLAQAQCVGGAANTTCSNAVANVTSGTLTWANDVEIRLTGEATSNDDVQVTLGIISLQSI